MTQPILVVAAAIVDHLDNPRELLAARRSVPPSLAGRWEFPGGKVEPGEAPLNALEREIDEELGVGLRLGAELVGPDDGAWICVFWTPNRAAYRGLGDMYVQDPRFEANYAKYGEGVAAFLRHAIRIYADANLS